MLRHITCLLMCVLSTMALAADVQVHISNAPDNGLIFVPLKNSVLQILSDQENEDVLGLTVTQTNGVPVPSQYVARRTLLLELNYMQISESRKNPLILEIHPIFPAHSTDCLAAEEILPEISVETASYRVTHRAEDAGGMPSRVEFRKSGHVLTGLHWQDRLIDFDESPENKAFYGGWHVREGEGTLTICSDGPIATVVCQTTPLQQGERLVPNDATSEYLWFYFKNHPDLIFVQHRRWQSGAHPWRENHFLELHIPDGSFPEWLGDGAPNALNPGKSGTFIGSKESARFTTWGAMRDAAGDSIAFVCPQTGIYDGLHGYGPYLHAVMNAAWTPWESEESRNSAWLVLGTFETPETLAARCDSVNRDQNACYVQLETSSPTDGVKSWREILAENLLFAGKIETPKQFQAIRSDSEFDLTAFDLYLLKSGDFACLCNSVEVLQIIDTKTGTCFLSDVPQPFFRLKYRENGEPKVLDSRAQLPKAAQVVRGKDFWEFEHTFVPSIRILTRFDPVPETSEIRVSCEARCSENVTLMEFTPLPLSFCPLGPQTRLCHPSSTGTLVKNPHQMDVKYHANYPSGWCTMPWSAIYEESTGNGLYFGVHDASGSTKTVDVNGTRGDNSICVEFRHPVPDRTLEGNGLQLRSVVLKSFHGDWFDAARFYRDWVRKDASWYPRELMGPDGRTDTPRWFKELNVWICDGGRDSALVGRIRQFQRAFGVPCAVHWYNWHVTPFDNDYPHYVPCDDFHTWIADLQKDGNIHVMPYINGRLWDTRDRGLEDWQFTATALPACTKQEDGKPYVESYGSREADDSPVSLGVMCPTTRLWQDKVLENVHKLMYDSGVEGVYIDQIAAAPPTLCMDKSHGHPLAGGSWWVDGYHEMMGRIQSDALEGHILTSECNAENFARDFDALLTWHVQSNDLVPAFSVVYAGSVQMFGRAHNGCNPMAYRMKTAQALTFGEQLGWCHLDVASQSELMAYMRCAVRFRSKIVPYFYRGEMARPAAFLDEIPTHSEPWKWFGSAPDNVLPTVLTSTWRMMNFEQPQTVERAVVIFTNYSDSAVTSRVQLDISELGFDPETVRLERIDSEGVRTPLPRDFFATPVTFSPCETWGVEILPR